MSRQAHGELTAVARALRETAAALEALALDADQPAPTATQSVVDAPWNARLWSVPTETRLTAEQAAEALGISRHALYKLTSRKRIRHARLGGRLTFTAGDLRQYVHDFEILAG